MADSWRMAQEIDKAIPVLEQAAKMSKEGETYILLGNLYLFEDRIEDSIRAIEAGLKKGKVKSESQAQLVLGQAPFEMENFEEAKNSLGLLLEIKINELKRQQIHGLNMLKMKKLE